MARRFGLKVKPQFNSEQNMADSKADPAPTITVQPSPTAAAGGASHHAEIKVRWNLLSPPPTATDRTGSTPIQLTALCVAIITECEWFGFTACDEYG